MQEFTGGLMCTPAFELCRTACSVWGGMWWVWYGVYSREQFPRSFSAMCQSQTRGGGGGGATTTGPDATPPQLSVKTCGGGGGVGGRVGGEGIGSLAVGGRGVRTTH